MVQPRNTNPSSALDERRSRLGGSGGGGSAARLNLLLSYGGWRDGNWADQLPCLLDPLGITSIRVRSGNEAARIISGEPIHIAVVDLRLPLDEAVQAEPATTMTRVNPQGGVRILQLLKRLDSPPPTVVVRNPTERTSAYQRSLNQALREGAFAVLDVPVKLELLLETMRRILKRYYANAWPSGN